MPQVEAILQKSLVQESSANILHHKDFEQFMQDSKVQDLKRVFTLFHTIDAKAGSNLIKDLKIRWRKFVF